LNNPIPKPPFKQVKGKLGRAYKRSQTNAAGLGEEVIIEPAGSDYVAIDVRSRQLTESANIGNKRIHRLVLSSTEAVSMGSILLHLGESLLDRDEKTCYITVSTEKTEIGENFIREDLATAEQRIARRKSRSHLFGLAQRCLETCTNEKFIEQMTANLAAWAIAEQDEFAINKAEKAIFQLGLVSKDALN
jgi:hypothetical protein